MKVSNTIQACVSKIVKKQRFVKDILTSIFHQGGKALLVGGAVRDLFLQRSVKDLDFEVYGLSMEQLYDTLQQFGIVSLVGKSFGVLRLHGIDIDWSLPRKDSSGRHPIVAYDPYMSYKQAFIRRDLTINAMGIDMQSFELVDLYGGLEDLHHKVLRSPDLNFFAQDPLRLLRVMQFVGRFEMSVDQDLLKLCTIMKTDDVSLERVELEFSKLFLESVRPSLGLQWLVSIHKFHEFLPSVKIDRQLFIALDAAAQENYQSKQEKLAVMWSVIMSRVPLDYPKEGAACKQATRKQKQSIIDCMKLLTREQKIIEQVADLVWYQRIIDVGLTDAQLKWLALWLAPHISLRLLIHFAMLQQDKERMGVFLTRVELLGVADAPLEQLVTGKDLLDVAQGVELGKLVKKAYQIQIDQGLTDRSVLKKLIS